MKCGEARSFPERASTALFKSYLHSHDVPQQFAQSVHEHAEAAVVFVSEPLDANTVPIARRPAKAANKIFVFI